MGNLQAGTSELQESHTVSTHAMRETISKVLKRSSCIPLRVTSGCCSRCRAGGERHEGVGAVVESMLAVKARSSCYSTSRR